MALKIKAEFPDLDLCVLYLDDVKWMTSTKCVCFLNGKALLLVCI